MPFVTCILTIFLLLSFKTQAEEASSITTALRMVKGKIETTYTVYALKTARNSIVYLTFDDKTNFIKANGENPENDELFIGAFGVSLSAALAHARKEGIQPDSWDFEKENETWIYLFSERLTTGKEKLIKIDASNGKKIPL